MQICHAVFHELPVTTSPRVRTDRSRLSAMHYLLVCAIFSLVFVWLRQRWHDRHSIFLATKVPSSKLQVILGFGPILSTKNIIKEFIKIAENYGKNALFYFGPFPYFVTSDPATIGEILTSKESINKSDIPYTGMSHAIGRGLFTLNDDEWKHHRKIVNPAFKIRNLMSFLPIFNVRVNGMFQDIDNDIENGINTPLLLFFREYTLQISFGAILGRDLDKTHHNVKEYAKHIARGLKYVSNFSYNCIYGLELMRTLSHMTYYKRAEEFTLLLHSIIAETLRGFAALRGAHPSYIPNVNAAVDYMDKGIQQNDISSGDAVTGLFHMFAGSFETTSTTLNIVLILLAIHPVYQERAYTELRDIFPADDDDTGEIDVTDEHIAQMVYLDMVLNEAMRVLPTIPQTGRKVKGGNLTLRSGVVLPDGQNIYLDIFNLHRSKEVWGPGAHEFNPDNFLPSNIEGRHPYAFIPFTKGLRFCIGLRYADLSVKVALARLIKRYKFSTTAIMDDLALENHISSQLTINPNLTAVRRKKSKNN